MTTKVPLTAMAWLRWDGIQRALAVATPDAILEVGAGQGALGSRLAERSTYVGVEPDEQSATVAAERVGSSGRFVRGTTDDLDPALRVDLLCAFEVLEHIEDDVAALADWRRFLPADGWVLISVPAHPDRFSAVDTLVGHHRRYSESMVRDLLDQAGFDVVSVESYGFGVGHALEWARTKIAARRPSTPASVGTGGSGRFLQPGRLSGFATGAVGAVGRVVQRPAVHSSRGVGWVVLGQRRSN